MNVIEQLFVAIGVDSSSIEKDIAIASKKIDGGVRRMAESIKTPFKTMFGAALGGLGFGALIKEYISGADALGKSAKSLGVSAESLHTWREAAKTAGGSVQGFETSVRRLNANIQAAARTGKGAAADAFSRMGVNLKDATGKARDAFSVMEDLAGAAEKMSAAEFEGMARYLGIDHGTVMLLQSGREELKKLIAAEREQSTFLEGDNEKGTAASDAIDKLKKAFMGLSFTIIRDVVPKITVLLEKATKFVNFLRRHETFTKAFIGGIALLLTATLIPAIAQTAIVFGGLSLPILGVVAAIAALAAAFDDIFHFIKGDQDSLIDLILEQFMTKKEIEDFRKDIQDIPKWVSQKIAGLMFILQPIIDWLSNIAEKAGTTSTAFKDFKDVIKDKGLIAAFTELDENGNTAFGNLIHNAGEFLAALNPFQAIIESIDRAFGDMLRNFVERIREAIKELNPFKGQLENIKKIFEQIGKFFKGEITNPDSRDKPGAGVTNPEENTNDRNETGTIVNLGTKIELDPSIEAKNQELEEENKKKKKQKEAQKGQAFNFRKESLDTLRKLEKAALGASLSLGQSSQYMVATTPQTITNTTNTTNNNDITINVKPEELPQAVATVKRNYQGSSIKGGVNYSNFGVNLG